MAIETRSATKRRAYQAAKELDMDWAEWSLSKLNALVEWPYHKIKAHIRIAITLFIFAIIGTTVFLTTNLFE